MIERKGGKRIMQMEEGRRGLGIGGRLKKKEGRRTWIMEEKGMEMREKV